MSIFVAANLPEPAACPRNCDNYEDHLSAESTDQDAFPQQQPVWVGHAPTRPQQCSLFRICWEERWQKRQTALTIAIYLFCFWEQGSPLNISNELANLSSQKKLNNK